MPTRETTGVTGCFHIHIEDGKIKNVFSHLGDFPDNCVIHVLPDKVYSVDEFKEDHFFDKQECDVPYSGKIHQLHALSIDIDEEGTVSTKMKYDVENNVINKK